MKTKKLLSILLVAAIIFSMSFSSTLTASAATGSKKVTSTGSMGVALNVGASGNSSSVKFVVSGLPSNATVTKIEVTPGSLTYQGGIMTNNLQIMSLNTYQTDTIAWTGAVNTIITSKALFIGSKANGTYEVKFNATCYGGAIVGGSMISMGSKTYSRPALTVYYTY